MSTLRLYQMFDTVAMTVFGPMIHGIRDEAVVRQFQELLADPNTQPGRYPADYILLHVGEQNQSTGEITPCDPQTIWTGKVFLRLQAQQKADAASPQDPNSGLSQGVPDLKTATMDQLLDELGARTDK